MKESYLHLIWKLKRLPVQNLFLDKNLPLVIIDPGIHNRTESGPDFTGAKILVDGILWVGHVEIHVRASDWYKHNHHLDPAYNNVILHVVLENDVSVFQGNRQIPCLELKDVLDPNHHSIFKDHSIEQSIPCAKLLPSIDGIYLKSMIDRVVVNRLERKYNEIVNYGSTDEYDILLWLIAKAFGTKVNSLPFEELAVRLTKPEFRALNRKEKKRWILHASGLFVALNESQLHAAGKDLIHLKRVNVGVVDASSWKFKGLRPPAFPNVRIQQFAEVISKLDFSIFFNPMSPNTVKEILEFHFEEINRSLKDKQLKLSQSLKDQLLINCFVPFLFWQGKKYELPDASQNALELLESIKPENNYIIKLFKDCGFKPKSALDSQGLLELYHSHCIKKKCLTCTVGNKVLKA